MLLVYVTSNKMSKKIFKYSFEYLFSFVKIKLKIHWRFVMIKKSLVFIIIFFIFFTNNTFAHTGIKSSSPENGETIVDEIQEIMLKFDTEVEQNSTFTLKTKGGDPISIRNINLDEEIMEGTLDEPLNNGDYELDWSIIGVDGHPIEGTLSFSVKVPNSNGSADEQSENKEVDSNSLNVDELDKESEPKMSINFIIPIIIGFLFLIVIGTFVWLLRRKK